MSLPNALTLVPVHGRILHLDTGLPATGTVSFRCEGYLRDTTDHVILGPTTITGTLDTNGEFTVSLPATDAAGVTPTGWTYAVSVATDAWVERFRITVPAATAGTLEFSDLAPAVPVPAMQTYVLTSKVGQVGGPAGPLGQDGLIPAEQIPGGGSGGGGVSLAGDLGGTLAAPQVTGTHLSAPLPLAQGGTGAASASAARTSLGAETAGAATTAVSAHTAASDPHGDRAAATSALSAHTAASDPHGSKAYTDTQIATRVPSSSTVTSNPAAPLISHSRNFAIDQTARNIMELLVNGTLQAWFNEWGGYRATPAYDWDAAIRLIMRATQTGNIFEVQNSGRTQALFGINASGRIVMGNGTAAAVAMTPVYVAQASDVLPGALPAGLPAGTVVIQLAS